MKGLEVQGLQIRILDPSSHQNAERRIEADFKVPTGGRAAIMGASGVGKSTLLRAIAGLATGALEIQKGRVLLDGKEISTLSPQKRELGFVFQDPTLFSSMRVLENAAFGLRVRGVSAKERKLQTLPWLEKLGLLNLAHQSVDPLSGGEKARVAWVRALVWKPRLLLLDEPFSALDGALKKIMRQDFLRLHRDWPVPLLWVTHDESDALEVATHRFEMVEGDAGIRKLIPRESESF